MRPKLGRKIAHLAPGAGIMGFESLPALMDDKLIEIEDIMDEISSYISDPARWYNDRDAWDKMENKLKLLAGIDPVQKD